MKHKQRIGFRKEVKQAYDLMQQAQEVDETVANFKDFIERIGAVDQINN